MSKASYSFLWNIPNKKNIFGFSKVLEFIPTFCIQPFLIPRVGPFFVSLNQNNLNSHQESCFSDEMSRFHDQIQNFLIKDKVTMDHFHY